MKRIAAMTVTGALVVSVAAVTGSGGWDASRVAPAYAMADGTSTTTTATTPAPPPCPTRARPFTPRTITVAGVTRRATVVTPPRYRGLPGSPSLTAAGKQQFAYDREQRVRPGDSRGNVLLNAHVWPDGSAVGNRLLAKLQVGGRIVLFGDSRKLCYRVTARIQVRPTEGLRRYYNRLGKPQIALVTCSGKRLAPGVWTKRTIWYASPAA